MSESIIHPSVHRGPPATRVRWRPEVALAGVAEQHPNPQCTSLGARDSDAGPMLVEKRAALLTHLRCATDAPGR